MEQELMALSERIDRMREIMGRLVEENSRLRADLAFSQKDLKESNERMAAARIKVETALGRLPLTEDQG